LCATVAEQLTVDKMPTKLRVATCAFGFRHHLHRFEFFGVGVVAIEFAELHVVRVHVTASGNIDRGKTDHHVVFQYRFALSDGARRHFVSGLHLATAGKAPLDLCTQRKIDARNHHVVSVVQANGLPGDGFFLDFNHSDSQ